MAIFLLIISFFYFLLIGFLVVGFDKIEIFHSESENSHISFSIIIPFRNEGDNIPALLNSILKLKYPTSQFEIIFVDDDSKDASVSIIDEFRLNHPQINVNVLVNEPKTNSAKKDAVITAINNAKHEWVLTTDADCTVSPYWLSYLSDFIHANQSEMVVGPVTYITDRSFLSKFQLLDFLGLQSTTIGSFGLGLPFLCNGANLAYSKQLFVKLNGFEGNLDIASGDDMFLLQKAVRFHRNSVHILKSKKALVRTIPLNNWNALIQQRIRWASKTTVLKNKFGNLIAMIVILMNLAILIGIIAVLTTSITLQFFLIIFGLKMIADFNLIYKSADLFDQENVLYYFIFSSFIYPFFAIIVALLSIFPNYKWKERRLAR